MENILQLTIGQTMETVINILQLFLPGQTIDAMINTGQNKGQTVETVINMLIQKSGLINMLIQK
jgi:hypothetical protein